MGECFGIFIIVLRLILESAINLGPVPEIDLCLIGECVYKVSIKVDKI